MNGRLKLQNAGHALRKPVQLFLVLLILLSAPAVFAIGDVDVVHDKMGGEAPGPTWTFCEGCCGGSRPFAAKASGLLDSDGDGEKPDATLDWKVKINGNTHTFQKHDDGKRITFDVPTTTAGEFDIDVYVWNGDEADSYEKAEDRAANTDVDNTVYVADITITDAPDWIVPGCNKNTIKYEIEGANFTTVKMEVFDKSDDSNGPVFSDITLATTKGSHSFDWNGKNSDGAVLTESASPYRIVLTGSRSDADCTDEETDQKIKEWYVYGILNDPLKDGWASGVNEDTVTDELVDVDVRFHHSGGTSSWAALSFSTVEKEYSVEMTYMSGDSYHIFYVMPPDKKYEMQTYIKEGGGQDHAHHEFDADHSQSGRQRHYSYTFRIKPDGTLRILSHNAW